jgi:hypothetical protein
MHIILGSFTKWTKRNQNTHIPHNVKAFVGNNIMNDTHRTRRKKNEVDKILMMQALTRSISKFPFSEGQLVSFSKYYIFNNSFL